MKARAYLLVLALLAFFTASCSKEDAPVLPEEENITPEDNNGITYVSRPYTVQAEESGSQTKTTVVRVGSKYYHVFEAEDRLFISGVDDPDTPEDESQYIQGVLKLVSGAGTYQAVFSSNINVASGIWDEDEPPLDLPIKAVLVSPNDKVHRLNSTVLAQQTRVTGLVRDTEHDPSNGLYAIATGTDIHEAMAHAVEMFGDLTAETTFGTMSYQLAQRSTFLKVTVTFDHTGTSGVTTADVPVKITFKTNPHDTQNNRSGMVNTVMSGEDAAAIFVLVFPGGTTVLDYDNLKVEWDSNEDGDIDDNDAKKFFSFTETAANLAGGLNASISYSLPRTVKDKDHNDLFTIEAINANTKVWFRLPKGSKFVPSGVIQYSTDGVNWTTVVEDSDGWVDSEDQPASCPITIAEAGGKIYLRGTFPCYQGGFSPYSGNIVRFSDNCYAYGDIMYMLGSFGAGDTFIKGTNIGEEAFNRFFYKNTRLYSKDGRDSKEMRKLELGTPNCTLSQSACKQMFNGCTNITMAPELEAMTIDPYIGKTNNMSETSYCQMFLGCTNLQFAPLINLRTPYKHTFGEMFRGCTKLRYIKCFVESKGNSNFSEKWIAKASGSGDEVGVAASGYFIMLDNNIFSTGNQSSKATWGIPAGWTVVTVPDEF